ncbi:uncharacterized protein LOC129910746 [Episyrphus balteatus]|uniref:uncharacterized protein LOC129910746 n=1 Tax=Episyrphus balteatus TaxID=286459 RepID=UPI0024867EEA|nr:uncharacterized protein LOC129910746 [Episyrphus balteatus]
MSSSSESEDENLKQILEAADTSLLTNSLYKPKETKPEKVESKCDEHPISQRHLNHDESTDIDFQPSETVQKIMAKKLSLLVQEQIEFITLSDLSQNPKKKQKNRVKLFNDCDCYVKPFEEFEYEDIGPRKKPLIQRRKIDDHLDEESKLKAVAVDGEFVLSLKETLNWSNRKKGKEFQYKQGKGINKDHHLIEPQNEFTKMRQKNQWNESRIRKAKFSTK